VAVLSPAAGATAAAPSLRPDLQFVASLVPEGGRVLDVGCGDGALLEHLVREKGVVGRGIELSQEGVNACVRRGLSVVQGNADVDLTAYPARSFDCVILSQTLQATVAPAEVLAQLVRIGRSAIVSFPNFGHYRVRLGLLFNGTMPVTPGLPKAWYETENIHLCTIRDFVSLADRQSLTVERAFRLRGESDFKPIGSLAWANLFGESGVFVVKA